MLELSAMSTVEPLGTTSIGMLAADVLAGSCPIPRRYMQTTIGKGLRIHRQLWIQYIHVDGRVCVNIHNARLKFLPVGVLIALRPVGERDCSFLSVLGSQTM